MDTTPLPPAAPPQTQQTPATARIWQAAQDFEATALGELLKPMFDTVDTAHGTYGGGEAEATWKPMLVDAIAKQISRHGGLGLAAPVYAEMLRRQEALDAAPNRQISRQDGRLQ